jgi:cephalosporin-C deacetylase-like acetyl esterase
VLFNPISKSTVSILSNKSSGVKRFIENIFSGYLIFCIYHVFKPESETLLQTWRLFDLNTTNNRVKIKVLLIYINLLNIVCILLIRLHAMCKFIRLLYRQKKSSIYCW